VEGGEGRTLTLELEHVYLQLQAAVEGLGIALASMPLIEGDIAAPCVPDRGAGVARWSL
jgi:hypothetical protein